MNGTAGAGNNGVNQSLISNVNQQENKDNNNTSFNYSFLKFGDKSLIAMDFDEIKTKISLLEDHMSTCEKKGKFVEAEMAKQRLAQLKKLEERKLVEEHRQNFERSRQLLELEQKIELDNMNEKHDKKFKLLMKKMEAMEEDINEKYNNMIEEFNEEFEDNFKVTPSAEMMELKKVLENLLKMKNYSEAHKVQSRINKLTQTENVKWESVKEAKMKKQLNNLKNKKQQELNTLQLKNTQTFNDMKKKRALELDTLIQKHKNKLKDLELQYKNELLDLNRLKTSSKVLGGNSLLISRPISRMSSKVSSAPSSPVYNKLKISSSNLKFSNSKLNTTKK